MKRIILFLVFGLFSLMSCAQYEDYSYPSDDISVDEVYGYQQRSNRSEYTTDGLPVIKGGQINERHVAQVDRERLVVHHRKIQDRVDVYDDYQPLTIRTQWTENFRCNSAELDNCGYTNIKNIVKFARDYPYSHFAIYGYADIETGDEEINYWLSKKRADKVRNELVRRYGIQANRVEVHYMGCSEQVYGWNNFNRCVIIKAF